MGGRMHFPFDLFLTYLLLASLFMVINAEDHHNNEEVENEHPFTYLRNDPKGPDHWGSLKPKWETCETGKLQSPIDLLNHRVEVSSALGDLRRTYESAPAVIKNRGHDIMVEWTGDAGGVVINGTEYKLQQCHWHTPSEHTVRGRRYNVELHMVHSNSQGELAVIGILFELGYPDPFLNKFLGHLHSVGEEEIDVGSVNPWDIKFGSRQYFRYLGSLTIPPCTEGVVWTILDEVRTVSMDQITALRKVVDHGFENNARPTQPWDGRRAYMYRPKFP